MIALEEALAIHQRLIGDFGGASGIRDKGLLESALHRPYSGFGETHFYGTPEEKASALLESVLINQPFVDGNKRTGYALARLVLRLEGKDLNCSEEEKYELVVAVASGIMDYDAILNWIRNRVIS